MASKYQYYKLIENEAKNFIEENKEELEKLIKENIEEEAEFIFDEVIYQEWDLNDKIHEYLDGVWYGFLREDVFNEYNTEFLTCSAILELSDEAETDTGLWEGAEPQEAIQTQAFFTVKNDLYFKVEELIKELIDKIKEQSEGV